MPHAVPSLHLHAFDLALIVAYLAGITLFGLRFRDRKGGARSLESYFLADRSIPWWAIALSIVSAETSTLTIISVPGLAFAGDFGFLQIVLGYMVGRIVVALLFLPKYFQGQMLTAYQLIDRRFGHALHKTTAGLFLITRAAAEGVRVFAVSIVVAIAIGTGDVLSIALISALTLLYTFEGGMAAVIWTDVVQMAIYIGGTIIAIATLGRHVPGGWGQIHQVAAAAGKFHLFNFALNLTESYTFWAGLIGGTFLTMASHGTDQLMVQRMLAARNLRESRVALLSSGVVIFVQFALFLFAIAVYSIKAGGKGHVVEIGLSIASVAYGALLGVFLLGTLTRYATQTGAIIGMIVGFTLNMFLWLQPAAIHLANMPLIGDVTLPRVAFTWYVLIGAAVTFAIGSLASLFFRKKAAPQKLAATTLILCLSLTHYAQPQDRVPHLRAASAKVGIGEADPSSASTEPQILGAPFIAPAFGAMGGKAQK